MVRAFFSIILVIVFLAFLVIGSWGAEFRVSTATELQDALTRAQKNGEDDVIKVAQGTYYGNFVYNSSESASITLLGGYKNFFLRREVNPSKTILDGNRSDRVLSLDNTDGGNISIEGFTIRNGAPTKTTGGLYACSSSSSGTPGNILIAHNIVEDNEAWDEAGGIKANSSTGDVIITHNVIRGNSCDFWGGGIDAYSGSFAGTGGKVIIVNNLIVGNSCTIDPGGGVFASASGAGGIVIITNNTIAYNNSGDVGGGISLRGDLINVTNNIIWGNSAPSGGDIELWGPGAFIGYNNDYSQMVGTWTIFGNNIHINPLFVGSGDFHLLSASPCIDKGINTAPHLPAIDLEGNFRVLDGDNDGIATADMGVYEYGLAKFPIFDGHDFDANGTSDISVWRPLTGRWYIKNGGSYAWGISSDIPVNGDYDGDGKTDIAVWRPSNGKWYPKGMGSTSWGISGDIPVPGNYNGDPNGTTDIAVWRPSNGKWYINSIGSYTWGILGDIPVPGDYNGDGITDIAVWRPSNGRWYIRGIGVYVWGVVGDIPVPADYNGDSITDLAVWRPSKGRWYILGMAGSFWGTAGDIPAPGDYNGDGITDIAVWRPSNGCWYIKGIGNYLWGMLGDTPLVR